LKAYLAGQGCHPGSRQEAQECGRQKAEQAISERPDPLRRKWFRKLLASARACAVERGNAIAEIGLPYPPSARPHFHLEAHREKSLPTTDEA
jgi:hypothetical protein